MVVVVQFVCTLIDLACFSCSVHVYTDIMLGFCCSVRVYADIMLVFCCSICLYVACFSDSARRVRAAIIGEKLIYARHTLPRTDSCVCYICVPCYCQLRTDSCVYICVFLLLPINRHSLLSPTLYIRRVFSAAVSRSQSHL